MFKGKIKFNFNIKKRIIPVILVSVLMPMILFVAIPFEMYANNMDELLFSLSSFYPLCILFGFLLAAGTALLLIFLPEKIYRVGYAVVLAASFLFFLQGTFLNFGMNSLGGDNQGSGDPGIGLKILDAIIWIVVLGVAVALSLIKDKKGIFAIIAVILALVVFSTQFVVPVTNTIKHTDVFMSREARLAKNDDNYKNEVMTNKNYNSVSGENNIYYFCIDKFDEYFAEVAYEQNPEIYANLDGFTWFQDHISLYGHTFPSIAYMLTEHTFDIKTQYRPEYLDSVYDDNKTLSVLNENGYSVNLFTQPYYACTSAHMLPDYVENVSVAKELKTTQPMKLTECFVKTSVYRCLPLFFKDWIYDVDTIAFNQCVTTICENGYTDFLLDNYNGYKQAVATPFTQRDGKNFSFIHIDGCHGIGIDYMSKTINADEKKQMTAEVESSFKVVNVFIDALKEKGLYENATIVITGDHPITVQARYALKAAKLTALFFKRSGDGGTPLAASLAPVAHENIWPTIMESENIQRENNGVTLFNVPENNERLHAFQTFNSYNCDEYIYKITGSGKDFGNWELIEHNYVDHCYTD